MAVYLTEHPVPTLEQLKKADDLEAKAKASRQRAEDSFQRCDTDGFLSQWANNIGADLDDRKAQILRHGGYARFPVLVDEDGTVVADREYKFPHPRFEWQTVTKWKIMPEHEIRFGRRWVPVSYTGKSRIQKQLGVSEDARWFPAYAEITTGDAKSTGLSGCANAYVGVFKKTENR